MRFKISIVILALMYMSSLFSIQSESEAKAEIVKRLQKWPQDFNAKNVEAVCGLFASDLIATYPGSQDRNYPEMCQHLTKVLKDQNQIYRYESPEIEQILVEGDMAVVRLIWTLKVSNRDSPSFETIRERGLDVFQHQSDGSWKISISYAYPEK